MIRQTHTYVELELSPAAYDEISNKMWLAGYRHAFHREGDGHVIDMHGIAVTRGPKDKSCVKCGREPLRGIGCRCPNGGVPTYA